MGKATQIIKVNKSLIDYFRMMDDWDNEPQQYREVTEREFKEKVLEALSKGTGMNGGDRNNIEIKWI